MLFPFLAHRREYRALIDAEATRLLAGEGEPGYYTARDVARLARQRGDHKSFVLWSRIAVEIARRTGHEVGGSKAEGRRPA